MKIEVYVEVADMPTITKTIELPDDASQDQINEAVDGFEQEQIELYVDAWYKCYERRVWIHPDKPISGASLLRSLTEPKAVRIEYDVKTNLPYYEYVVSYELDVTGLSIGYMNPLTALNTPYELAYDELDYPVRRYSFIESGALYEED